MYLKFRDFKGLRLSYESLFKAMNVLTVGLFGLQCHDNVIIVQWQTQKTGSL